MLAPLSRAGKYLYKWTDSKGKVRYGDVLPRDQANKAYQIIDRDGRVLKTRRAAKTPEQIRRERAEKRRREKQARLKAQQRARQAAVKKLHDNVLLMTFTNEDEIKLAKQERLAVINSVINLLRKNITREKQKLAREKKIAKTLYLDKGVEIPGGQAQKIEYFSQKVLTKQQHLSQKLKQREKITEQYDKDLIRYRELIQQKKREEAAKAKARREAEKKALYQ